jgi:hypothetical protein
MNFKLKEEMNYPLVLNNLIDDYACLNIELGTLALNMKKEVCEVIDFSFFLDKYEEKKAHNLLFLVLDLKFKS